MEIWRSIARDLAHAARSLSKARAFTLVCVLSLGIGMGAFVALATLSRAVMAPARGIDTAGLVELLVLPLGPLRAQAGEWALERWSYPDYQAVRNAGAGLAVTAWVSESSLIGERTPDSAAPPRVATLYVSANYFRTFGVRLARGPGFDPALDAAASAAARVVVSHDFWRTRMGSNPDAVGSFLTIDDVAHEVVGIAPEGFYGHFHFFQTPGSLVFVPLERHPRLRANPELRFDRGTDWLRLHGRLDPGVDRAEATAAVSAVMAGLARQFPATNEFKAATVEPYASLGAAGRPESRRVTATLLGLSGAVLAIVCLNISGMMLVRGMRRERELSIREALGAGRRRLVQYLFFEAVWLAALGGGIGAFVLFGIPAVIGWWIGAPVPLELDFDATGMAITAGLCLLVSVLFGLLPAIRFSRSNLTLPLKEDAWGGGRRTIRVHRVAAAAQIGIAMPFLIVSGVMFDRVRTAEFGFETDGLVATRLPVPDGPDGRDAGFFIRRVGEHLRESGSVRAAAVAEGMPVDFDYRIVRVARDGDAESVRAQVTRVGEGFLETLGVPMLRGRSIAAGDRGTGTRVAVISEPLARQLFGDGEPIGGRVRVARDTGEDEEFTVVGVSADFVTSQLTTERPQILLPLAETLPASVFLLARGAPGEERTVQGALENVARELGVEPVPAELGVFHGVFTGHDLARKSLDDVFVESVVVGVVGTIVLVLAALGIVGVVGFAVATRTREFAVRMALGATRPRVFGLMLGDVVKLVVPGVAGGLLIGAVLIRTMEDVLGTPLAVGPTPLGVMEPVIYTVASAIAVLAALVAGLPAARRATSVQPMAALRAE